MDDVTVEGLKSELAGHVAAGREDRAAEVVAELKRLGVAAAKPERATRASKTEKA